MALLTSQNERIRVCMIRKVAMGTRTASRAAANIGMTSLRMGKAKPG